MARKSKNRKGNAIAASRSAIGIKARVNKRPGQKMTGGDGPLVVRFIDMKREKKDNVRVVKVPNFNKESHLNHLVRVEKMFNSSIQKDGHKLQKPVLNMDREPAKKLSDENTRDRGTCKARPENNKKTSGGGAARKIDYIPWCR